MPQPLDGGAFASQRVGRHLRRLLVKLRLERAWAVPIGFDSGWAFNVIYAAHLTGAVAGAALALLLEACHRLFGRRPPRAAVD